MYYLNGTQVERIRRTVEKSERELRRANARKLKQPVSYPMFAKLGEVDSTNGRYSWTGVLMNQDGTMEVDSTNAGSGDKDADEGYAICIYRASINCIRGSIVKLEPAYTGDHFIFDYHLVKEGTTGEDIAAGASGNVLVSLDTGGTQTVVAKNGYSEAIDENTYVTMVFQEDGTWLIVGSNCEADE